MLATMLAATQQGSLLCTAAHSSRIARHCAGQSRPTPARCVRSNQTAQLQSHRLDSYPTTAAQEQGLDRRAVLLTSAVSSLLWQSTALAAGDKVFVAGAAGKTGRKVVEYLVGQGLQVRAGVRDIQKAKASGLDANSSVTLVNGDVTSGVESLSQAIGDAKAVICATGYGGLDGNGYDKVDRLGTIALVDAAKKQGVSKFVLMSSLLTNGAAKGQGFNPTFLALNVFGGVLSKKLEAEKYLRQSGLNYTIVRPGGLSSDPPEAVGQLVVRAEDTTFGLPGEPGRSISRTTVAQVLAQAVLQPSKSSNKVVEVVAGKEAPQMPPEEWFTS